MTPAVFEWRQDADPDDEIPPDEGSCDLRPCTSPVGWALDADDRMTWHPYLAVAGEGEDPCRFCEDCGGWLTERFGTPSPR